MPELDDRKSRQEHLASVSKAYTALSVEMTNGVNSEQNRVATKIITPLCLSFNQADAAANAE